MNIKINFNIVDIEDDGCHPLVKVIFNKKHTGFLILDTGASKSVFDLKKLTSMVKIIPFDKDKIKSSGITKGFLQSKVGIIPQLQIGKLILKDYNIVMLDLSHINKLYEKFSNKQIWGLIGGDFFKKYQAKINYRNCTLTINSEIKTTDE